MPRELGKSQPRTWHRGPALRSLRRQATSAHVRFPRLRGGDCLRQLRNCPLKLLMQMTLFNVVSDNFFIYVICALADNKFGSGTCGG